MLCYVKPVNQFVEKTYSGTPQSISLIYDISNCRQCLPSYRLPTFLLVLLVTPIPTWWVCLGWSGLGLVQRFYYLAILLFTNGSTELCERVKFLRCLKKSFVFVATHVPGLVGCFAGTAALLHVFFLLLKIHNSELSQKVKYMQICALLYFHCLQKAAIDA